MDNIDTSQLPIHAIRDQILSALRTGNRLVLTAPTGSGKTTQVPRFLYESDLLDGEHRQILVLQPRRLAARIVAARVAAEVGCPIGDVVGYQTRHDSKAGPRTVIRFLTEGLFLRQLQANPKLTGVGAVILDEFHERNLASDAALAMVKLLQDSARPDLRLIVMSATLDTKLVSNYLACPTLEAHGRMFPVRMRYMEKRTGADAWELAADALADILDRRDEGDVLVFMPGAYEIRRTIDLCQRHGRSAEPLAIFPLYSELPVKEQDEALAPAPHRRVIVSTNVAETSITIPGIRHVIDSGLARINRFDPRRGINVLRIEPISQSSAEQRAGRAGRTAPGTCTRLWTELEHRSRPAHATPEVQRLDLAEVILQLHAFGVHNAAAFPWLESPAALAIEQAVKTLKAIDAIDAAGRLTPQGKVMAHLPMHPRLSRMLIEAAQRNCLERATLWAAFISERDILIRNAKHRFAEDLPDGPRSDFFVLENAFHAAKAARFDVGRCAAMGVHALACREIDKTQQLYETAARGAHLRMVRSHPLPSGEGRVRGPENAETAWLRSDGLVAQTPSPRPSPGGRGTKGERPHPDPLPEGEGEIRALLVAFPDHLAIRRSESNLACAVVNQRKGNLDPESVAKAVGLVLPVEIREIGAGSAVRTVLSLATEIKPEWLEDVLPRHIAHRKETLFNAESMAVETFERDYFDDLIISEKIRPEADKSAAAEILAEEVFKGSLKLERWDESVEQWIARTRCVAAWFPERQIITYSDDDRRVILSELCAGATRYSQIKDRPCLAAVKDALSWTDQQFVEKMAPERIQLPSGYRMRIDYTPGQAPRGRARIQDFYGLSQTPLVAGGRQKVIVELLAPSMRPIQTTDDLANFWKNLYPTVKKELSRRYPKHKWL